MVAKASSISSLWLMQKVNGSCKCMAQYVVIFEKEHHQHHSNYVCGLHRLTCHGRKCGLLSTSMMGRFSLHLASCVGVLLTQVKVHLMLVVMWISWKSCVGTCWQFKIHVHVVCPCLGSSDHWLVQYNCIHFLLGKRVSFIWEKNHGQWGDWWWRWRGQVI